tara:strand:+ start:263 stop:1624 length:1362 start_codon:yes stop_codon:yes gene_type:complete
MAEDRIALDKKAKAEFLDLNFFYKGRGMVVTPDMIKFYDALKTTGVGTQVDEQISKRWGFNTHDNKIVGLFNEPYKKMAMGVLGCVACHSGKAAGEFVIGLGNKNMDVGQVGSDAYIAQLLWGSLPRKNPEFKIAHKRAMEFVSVIKNKNINNLSQGLVPTSLVKSWFYDVTDTPIPLKFGRGQVKIPHLWGYGEKRKTGSFWDGFADGVLPGWAVAVELRGGQTPENIREYLDKVHHAEDALGHFFPPKYPFEINTERAARGKHLFNQTCYKCHGTYERDSEGLPLFKSPKFIPHHVVKTDSERLDFVSDSFLELIDINPLNDIMRYKDRAERRGYVAPRLWGIWSRFPYLHNASVPTLMDLLSPGSTRPVVFDLNDAGERERFDEQNLGLKVNRDKKSWKYKMMAYQAKKGKRSIYDTSRDGHGNQGHEFKFYKDLTLEDKKDLIEYLKTL